MVVVIVAAGCASTGTVSAFGPYDGLLQGFKIGRGTPPTLLTVPVRIKGKNYAFIVDTGSSITVYDSSMRRLLGEPIDVQTAHTGAGTTQFETFHAPEAFLGAIGLPTDGPVGCSDLASVRQAVKTSTGEDIYGLLGMDVLRKLVVQLDFDAGNLAILEPGKSQSKEWGEALPLQFQGKGVPTVRVMLPDGTAARFIIDTGDASMGDLRGEIFQELSDAGHLKIGGETSFATGSGGAQHVRKA